MSVENVCSYNVVTIAPDASVNEAARSMREHHIGDVVVAERRDGLMKPVGIVTDRDLVVEVLAQDVPPDKLTVTDIMSSSLLVVSKDNGLEYALRQMHEAGVRRAPVVDSRGELVGLLSVDDVIDYIARITGQVASTIRTEYGIERRKRP